MASPHARPLRKSRIAAKWLPEPRWNREWQLKATEKKKTGNFLFEVKAEWEFCFQWVDNEASIQSVAARCRADRCCPGFLCASYTPAHAA